MSTLTTINTNLNKLDARLADSKQHIETGVTRALEVIIPMIEERKATLDINNRKSIKLVEQDITDGIKTLNNRVKRAYKVAITIVARGLKIHADLLSLAQIENLVKYGQVKEINNLYNLNSEETYAEEVALYLRELKTREITVKAFPLKGKK